jgi:hypothetical protein
MTWCSTNEATFSLSAYSNKVPRFATVVACQIPVPRFNLRLRRSRGQICIHLLFHQRRFLLHLLGSLTTLLVSSLCIHQRLKLVLILQIALAILLHLGLPGLLKLAPPPLRLRSALLRQPSWLVNLPYPPSPLCHGNPSKHFHVRRSVTLLTQIPREA